MCKVPIKNNGRHREKGIGNDCSPSLPSRGKLKCIKHSTSVHGKAQSKLSHGTPNHKIFRMLKILHRFRKRP